MTRRARSSGSRRVQPVPACPGGPSPRKGRKEEVGHRPARHLTSFRPGDDRLWVALRLAVELNRLTLEDSSVLGRHGELRKRFRRERRWKRNI